MRVQVKCPNCGKVLLKQDTKGAITDTFCDSEDGGCDQTFLYRTMEKRSFDVDVFKMPIAEPKEVK